MRSIFFIWQITLDTKFGLMYNVHQAKFCIRYPRPMLLVLWVELEAWFTMYRCYVSKLESTQVMSAAEEAFYPY